MTVRLSRRKLSSYFASSIAKGVDEKKLIKQLAAYMVDQKRTKELQSFVYDIEYQLGQNGQMVADVVSAHSLSESVKAAVVSFVEQTTGAKKTELREQLDPAVIGGIKLEFAGLRLDTTITGRLQKLQNLKGIKE